MIKGLGHRGVVTNDQGMGGEGDVSTCRRATTADAGGEGRGKYQRMAHAGDRPSDPSTSRDAKLARPERRASRSGRRLGRLRLGRRGSGGSVGRLRLGLGGLVGIVQVRSPERQLHTRQQSDAPASFERTLSRSSCMMRVESL